MVKRKNYPKWVKRRLFIDDERCCSDRTEQEDGGHGGPERVGEVDTGGSWLDGG